MDYDEIMGKMNSEKSNKRHKKRQNTGLFKTRKKKKLSKF